MGPTPSPSMHTVMQSCSAWTPGSLRNTQVISVRGPCPRRKLGSPAYSLSLATVKELVASNRSKTLFNLLKGEVSMVSWAQWLLCYCLLCQLPCAVPAAYRGCRLLLMCGCCGHIGESAY